jgi:transcriptional regulator with XRE-family HTH domain
MNGYSLRDMAEKTGLSNPFISQLETGKAEPSLRTAVALSKCYGITLDRMAKCLEATCRPQKSQFGACSPMHSAGR